MKLCKDCKHFAEINHGTRAFTAVCRNDRNADINPVYGYAITNAIEQLRRDDTKCGPGGIYWEAKDGQ